VQAEVLVLYNLPTLPASHAEYASEAETVETAQCVAAALQGRGWTCELLGLDRDLMPLLDRLARRRPRVVFNLFEGFADAGESEAVVAGLLEYLGIPHTGSPAATLAWCRDKLRAKLLLLGAGLATPPFLAVDRLPCPAWPYAWPAIVKPALQDASVGIDHSSVVSTPEALEKKAADLLRRYGPPVLVEQFITGREINVAIVADPQPEVLPLSEILFQPRAGKWPLVSYEAKWKPGSEDDLATRPQVPAQVAPELASQLAAAAIRAFRLFGCRQYARCDFRVDDSGVPFLLEVNPNPDLHPAAGFANSLRAAGRSYEQFLSRLVELLVAEPDAEDAIRGGRPNPAGPAP
jgi:D-alanine-D-alanine ligase